MSVSVFNQVEQPYLGLAPFLRMDLAGESLIPIGQLLLSQAQSDSNHAGLLMNLSIIMQSLGQRETGLAIQLAALDIERIYTLPAKQQPAKTRLLVLVIAGDIGENTPIDCLLEDSQDVDIIYYFVGSPDQPLDLPIPEHNVLMVGICHSDEHIATLNALVPLLTHWTKPIINRPECIFKTERNAASSLLSQINGINMPATTRTQRSLLENIVHGHQNLSESYPDCAFPIIIRPVGSHAGRGLEKIVDIEALADYLAQSDAVDFFISRFIDYRNEDGQYRKMRVALIAGKPYICHYAISDDWMIHYINAGMYTNAAKRNEEALFMAHFDAFTQRHQATFDAIYQRTQLDYLGIDCAETATGELLIFEIDNDMIIHDMDPAVLFPYKHEHMQKVVSAFTQLLDHLSQSSGVSS